MPTKEHFERLGTERLIYGDLFAYKAIVVPIMTKGRVYGSISQRFREGPLPALSLTEARFVEMPARKVIFVALWSDDNRYSDELIYNCTRACLYQAAHNRVEQLAFPLLGGARGRDFIGAMEKAVSDHEDQDEITGLGCPEVLFVTNDG